MTENRRGVLELAEEILKLAESDQVGDWEFRMYAAVAATQIRFDYDRIMREINNDLKQIDATVDEIIEGLHRD